MEVVYAWYLFLREQDYSQSVLIAHLRGDAESTLN